MTDKSSFGCEFCKAKFTTETYLVNHLCEKKRRWLHREDKPEKLAFIVYHHFYMRQMGRRSPNQRSFINSRLYGAFVRFARHVIDLEAINPLAFVDFLSKIEWPLDRWTNPEVYARYIRELTKNETPIEAIERNFMLMQQWSVSSGAAWQDFFRLIAPPLATLWIITGRISPWLLFTASSAMELLHRLNPEQAQRVEQAVDTEYWQAKIALHQDDVERIRHTLAEHRI